MRHADLKTFLYFFFPVFLPFFCVFLERGLSSVSNVRRVFWTFTAQIVRSDAAKENMKKEEEEQVSPSAARLIFRSNPFIVQTNVYQQHQHQISAYFYFFVFVFLLCTFDLFVLFVFLFFLNSCIPVFSQIFEVFFGGGGGCRHCKMLKYLPPIKLYSLFNGEWISLEFFTPKSNHGTVAADGQYHKNNSCWYLRDILFFSFNYLTIMTKRIQKVKWPKKKKNRKYYNYFVLVLFIYFCLFVCLLFLFKK